MHEIHPIRIIDSENCLCFSTSLRLSLITGHNPLRTKGENAMEVEKKEVFTLTVADAFVSRAI